jgi:anti-sigma regulatory factor (Ser/Thr protein kinase)
MSLTSIDKLGQSYDAVAASVPAARRALTQFAQRAGADSEQLDAIRLAASEAITNAVVHAYDGVAGRIHVSAALASGELWVLIADDGCGLQVTANSPGLGAGLALISEVTDSFAIVKRSNGGTEVRMRFNLDAPPLPEERYSRGSNSSATSPASSSFSTTT